MRPAPGGRRVPVVVQPVAVPGAHRSVRVLGGLVVGRLATPPAHGVADAAGEDQHDQHADHAGEAAGEPRVVDALVGVVGERAVGGRVVVGGVEEAGLLGDVLEPVGVAAGVVAADAGEQQRDEQAGRGGRSRVLMRSPPRSGSRAAARRSTRPGAVDEVGADGDDAARPRAPVISASPMPITTCQPSIAVSTVAERRPAPVPPTANSPTKASAATGHRDQRGDPGRDRRTSGSRFGSTACSEPEHQPADADAPTSAIRVMLVPSAVMPPSAKSRPGPAARRARQSARRPRADQDRGQRAAEQVAAGAGADREVDHLARRRRTPRRGRPSARYGRRARGGPAQRDRHAGRGDHAGGDRGRGVEEAVGDVHVDTHYVDCDTSVQHYVSHRRNRSHHPMSPSDRLSPGDTAPDFTLTADTGEQVSLSRPARPQGDRLLLPGRDDARAAPSRPATSPTPSTRCRAPGYEVLGISPDKPEKLAKFRERDGLTHHPALRPGPRGALRPTARSARRSSTARSSRASSARRSSSTRTARIELAQYNVKATGHVAKLRRDLGLDP